MLIRKVGLVCISTGVESFLDLPRPMTPHDALNYCGTHYKEYRHWLCFEPVVKNGNVMIPYDYYIICLSLSEAESFLRMEARQSTPNYIKQTFRTRGLLDCSNNVTPAGKYVVALLKTTLFI